jgi:hypothetical protein
MNWKWQGKGKPQKPEPIWGILFSYSAGLLYGQYFFKNIKKMLIQLINFVDSQFIKND